MEKIYTKYLIISLIITIITSCQEQPRDWSVTYSSDNNSPFGCALFDNVIEKCAETYSAYEIDNLDSIAMLNEQQIWQIRKMDSLTVKLLNKRTERGLSTIVATDDFEKNIIQLSSYLPFDVKALKCDIDSNKTLTNSTIESIDSNYLFPSTMCGVMLQLYSSPYGLNYQSTQILAAIDNLPIIIKYTQDNASVVLVSTPLIFTNYGILYYDLAKLDVRIISELGSKDIKRYYERRDLYSHLYTTENKRFGKSQSLSNNSEEAKEESDNFLIRLFFIALYILFLAFYARRRERVIPVIETPRNMTIDFVKQVSLNHFWEKDYREMVCKKFIFFASKLRDKLNINLDDDEQLTTNIDKLSSTTNISHDEIKKLIDDIYIVKKSQNKISVNEMKRLINEMNKIIKKLK